MKQPILDYAERRCDKTCNWCGMDVCRCLMIEGKENFCSIECHEKWQNEQKRMPSWMRICIAVITGLVIVVGYYYFSS